MPLNSIETAGKVQQTAGSGVQVWSGSEQWLGVWLFAAVAVGFVLVVLLRMGHYGTFLQGHFRHRGGMSDLPEVRATWLPFAAEAWALATIVMPWVVEQLPWMWQRVPWTGGAVLAALAGAAGTYFLVLRIFYWWADGTFFTASQHHLWRTMQVVTASWTAMALWGLSVVAVCVPLDAEVACVLLIAIVVLAKTGKFFCCFRAFFSGWGGAVHGILYFCALEIAPLLVAVRLMSSLGEIL